MLAHKDRVANIVDQLKNRPEGQLASIRKSTPHHQIHDLSWKDNCYRVDVSSLSNIIAFETDNVKDRAGLPCAAHVVAEGQVTMLELAAACLDRGLLPHTVPEYSNFTVAGLINGEGIQSSSYRYGVFSHTVIELEIVLGDGSVVKCSATENAHLFSHVPESMGSIGIVTMAKIACRRAAPWVLTDYEHFTSRAAFVDRVTEICKEQKDDFMEGLVCAKGSYLVIRSNFVPSPPTNVPRYFPEPHDTEHGNLWYYQYVRYHVLTSNFSRVAIPQDAIPADQFLFRGMRGAWWLLEMHINLPALCGLSWFRRQVDAKVAAALHAKGFGASGSMTRAEEERCMVFQDMGINLSRLDEGIKWVEERIGVYPLWICPVDCRRHLKTAEHLHGPPAESHIVDIGIYGEPTVQPYRHNRVMPDLERFVDAPSTWGMSYHYTKESLKALLDPVRGRYHAIGVFPGVEDKIRFPDSSGPKPDLDEGPIPCWRLYREYGKYWWIKLPLAVIAIVTVLSMVAVSGFKLIFKGAAPVSAE